MDANSEFIPTKSALVKRDSVNAFECVVYESHKAKNKSVETKISTNNRRNESDRLDMKKVTHEVVKFSIAGMKPEEKREAKKNLALKLGAKPPKKDYVNYKILLERKKKEKAEQSALPDDPMNDNLRKKKGKNGPTLAEKRKNNILEAYGKPGQIGVRKKRRRK